MFHPSGWVMFSGGAHWRWVSLSTSEERLDGYPSLTLMAERWCWWRNERQIHCPAAWRISSGPSPNGVPHSGMDQKQTLLGTAQAQSQQLGPSWTQGQFPVLGTGVAPRGYFPLSLLVPRDWHDPTGHSPASHSHHSSWQCIFHGPFVAPMACPTGHLFCRAVAPSSQQACCQLLVGQLRCCKTRERGEIAPFPQQIAPQLEIPNHSSKSSNPG